MIKPLIKVSLTITAMYSNSYAASEARPPREPISLHDFIDQTEAVRATLVEEERRLTNNKSEPHRTLLEVVANRCALVITKKADDAIYHFGDNPTEPETKVILAAVVTRGLGLSLAYRSHFMSQEYSQNVERMRNFHQSVGDFIAKLRALPVLDPTRMITFRSSPIDIAAARDSLSRHLENEQAFAQDPRDHLIQVARSFEPLAEGYLTQDNDYAFNIYIHTHRDDPAIRGIEANGLRLGMLSIIAQAALANFENIASIAGGSSLQWIDATAPARGVLHWVDEMQICNRGYEAVMQRRGACAAVLFPDSQGSRD
jgi:hypothetical protein